MGEERKVLVGKPEVKRPLGRPSRRWEDGIRMNLTLIGCGSAEWFQLAQDRDRWGSLVNTVMNLRILAPRSYLLISYNTKITKKCLFREPLDLIIFFPWSIKSSFREIAIRGVFKEPTPRE
jgi:hypothetical protein